MPRQRLTIGTFGDISTRQMPSGRYKARTRYRDWDGHARLVQGTGAKERPIGAMCTNRGLRLITEELTRLVRPGAAGEHELHGGIIGEQGRDVERCGDDRQRTRRIGRGEDLRQCQRRTATVDEQRHVGVHTLCRRARDRTLRCGAHIHSLRHRQCRRVERDRTAVCLLHQAA